MDKEKVGVNMAEYEHIIQPFDSVYDENSEVIILGTLPSVKSRETNFYYGHKQNRFWRVIAGIFDEEVPETVEQKKILLLKHHIAIWDVIESCDIIGSSDSSIKNPIPADVKSLIEKTKIKAVYANGALAKKLYDRYIYKETGIEAIKLSSTSPANARCNLENLMKEWKIIKNEIKRTI